MYDPEDKCRPTISKQAGQTFPIGLTFTSTYEPIESQTKLQMYAEQDGPNKSIKRQNYWEEGKCRNPAECPLPGKC